MKVSFGGLAAALTLLLCACIVQGCGSEASKAAAWQKRSVLVKVSTAKVQPVTDSSIFSGIAKSRHSVTLSPQVEGQISQIFVQVGQCVKSGQPLMEISPDKQQASVSSYKFASWSNEKELSNGEKQLKSLQSQKVAKESNLRLAANNRDRYASLCSTGAVSTMDYDQRVNTFESAKAELEAINAQIEAQQEQLQKIKEQIKQSAANLRQQQVELQYHTVKAPFDGIVGEIPVKRGHFVNTSTQLTSVTQNHPLEVYVEVPVERSSNLTKGTIVELEDAENHTIGTSQVFFIAPNVSPENQTVLVKTLYENQANNLRADQIVKAKLIWNTHRAVTVPTEAVCHQSGEDFMFLAQSGKDKGTLIAKQVSVKLGDIENSQYHVLKGIKPGDRIIVSGVQNLADKAPITIAND